MARLTARERDELPDSAFAYVDSKGKRRLPINDEPHVRNALARFNQVKFETDAARENARTRVLRAAKKYGIVPVGFIEGQFEAERKHATAGRLVVDLDRIGASQELEDHLRRVLWDPNLKLLHWSGESESYVDGSEIPVTLPTDDAHSVTYLERDGQPMTALVHNSDLLDDPDLAEAVLAAVRFIVEKEHLSVEAEPATSAPALPAGTVTLLMTDIEGSTELLARLGDRYEELLADLRSKIRTEVVRAGGQEVDVRADEYFAVFEDVEAAIGAAVAFQQALGAHRWPDQLEAKVRTGIHRGPTILTDEGYIGLAVHTAARLCSAGHGGQILISGDTVSSVESTPSEVSLQSLGLHRLRGLPEPEEILQVEAEGLETAFPRLRTSVAAPAETAG